MWRWKQESGMIWERHHKPIGAGGLCKLKKSRKHGLPSEPLEGTRFSPSKPLKPFRTSDLQKCKIINLYCLKFVVNVTAAIENESSHWSDFISACNILPQHCSGPHIILNSPISETIFMPHWLSLCTLVWSVLIWYLFVSCHKHCWLVIPKPF